MTNVLCGVDVLVTRPEPQGRELAELISGLGGEPILFPAIEIELLPEPVVARGLKDFRRFELAVFVSANAARAAMPAIRRGGGIPRDMRVAAIGPGTAAGLIREGLSGIIVPESGSDSEALLRTFLAMQPAPKRVLIVRGEGGRDWLGESMRETGAEVEYLECYRRVRPQRRFSDLPARWRKAGGRRACVATSAEIVANLFSMAGDEYRDPLRQVPFFVSHPRVASAAFRSGVRSIFVAGTGDERLAQGLGTWFGRLPSSLPTE